MAYLTDRSTPMPSQADTRERLVLTAASLWHSRSYADVGVSEICEQAGVKKGSFYHFFPSKSAVALAVLERRREQAVERVFRPALDRDASPLEKLVGLMEVHYEMQRAMQSDTGAVMGCPVGNLALELSTQDEEIRAECARLLGDWASTVEPLLAEAVEAGELPRIDVSRAAMAVVAYGEGILLLAKTRNDPELIRELGPGVRQLVAAFELDNHDAGN
jgi:TetR/AcrR family transcriptional repressor of nem operon